jgi:uncharacterized membrane protein YvbJ
MKYCRNCGKEMADEAVICVNCGVPVNERVFKNINSATNDRGGFWWGVLGFFFPIVGLILYLVWKDTKPVTALAVGKGALIGVIVDVAVSIISVIIASLTLSDPYNFYINYLNL